MAEEEKAKSQVTSDKNESSDPTNQDPNVTADGAEEPSKIKKIKKILIIVVPILVAAFGGLYFYFFVLKGANNTKLNQGEHSEQHGEIKKAANHYVDLDPITVGLLPSSNKQEYLRIKITLRVSDEQENSTVLSKVPVVKDSIITFLRSLRSTDFNRSGSTLYLREEILKRVNKITAPISVKEVLFQEITVK